MNSPSAAHPEWFVEHPRAASDADRQLTVLLAEDSTFFRKQVRQYLESEGFDVIDCEDGQQAWETLTAGEHSFDLVVTDIEMPRLNGFEFSRRIKDHPTFRELPIIALTSLAGDEDRRRGEAAGIDEYQVKIDREQVTAAIWRLLGSRPPAPASHPPTAKTTQQECLV